MNYLYSKMRYTKYYSNYGFVTREQSGAGLFDFIGRLPPSVINAGKKAATSIATQSITAAGDRIGSELANRIAPKKQQKTAVRENILNSLQLTAAAPASPNQYGFGKKVRGRGIKILK